MGILKYQRNFLLIVKKEWKERENTGWSRQNEGDKRRSERGKEKVNSKWILKCYVVKILQRHKPHEMNPQKTRTIYYWEIKVQFKEIFELNL